VFTALGFCSSNKGLYLSAITEALGIKRSLFSINDSIRYISSSLVNLAFGVLISKFGARKLIGAGFVSLIISTLIYAYAENIFLFYAGGMFLGIGLCWTTTTMVGYVVNRWCKEHKGTIMGLILCSNGLGGALAAQIVTPIIYDQSTSFGYRNAYKLVAVILLVVGIVVVSLFRDAPGLTPSKEAKKPQKPVWNGVTFAEAIRKPYFYGAALCIFLTGASLQGVTGISSAHLSDVGIDAAYLATTVSVHSLVLAGAKFLTGFLHDKLGLRITMVYCYIAGVIAFVCLALSNPTASGRTLAMVYSIFSSLALPLETIMLPLITGDIFGQASYAKMLGLFVSVNTAGYAVGAPLTNVVFDIFGSYAPVLYVLSGVLVIAMIAFLVILKVVDKEKKAIEAKLAEEAV
jgi:MFS family permease